MGSKWLGLYLAYLAVIASATWFGMRLVRNFRLYFLSAFLGYLAAFDLTVLINLVVNDLSASVLRSVPVQTLSRVYILFGLVALPLMMVSFYFLLVFVFGFLDRELSTATRLAYTGLWVAFAVVFLLRVRSELGPHPRPYAQTLSLVASTLILLLPLAALGYLGFRVWRGRAAAEFKGTGGFAAASLAGFLLFFFTLFISQLWPSLLWFSPLFLLAANFLPLLTLERVLKRLYRPIPHGPGIAPALAGFSARHHLSEREREILHLLLAGKSNGEMSRLLFISGHTVRNHVHNIYQKLGVRSRLHLLNRVRSWLDEKAS
jgi:DNA-binding CsgD family transcriptional regulator